MENVTTENLNKINATVGEITELYFLELDRVNEQKNSNTPKNRQKIEMVLDLLQGLPENLILDIEGVRGNGEIRDFYIPNVGSVVECIIKYFLRREKPDEIAKTESGKIDTVRGWCNYEIKASLSANSLATPSESETTILVNRTGVYTIRKADTLKYVNKYNRLPHNQPCGTPDRWLMHCLDYVQWAD